MCRPGICNVEFPYRYTYITDANADRFRDGLSKTINFKYSIHAELEISKTPRDYARLVRDFIRVAKRKYTLSSPLIKDPMALLSVEWLAKTFDMNVLVLIRHPAAFVSSCKQLGWDISFEDFLNQPLLMEDYLYPFAQELIHYTNSGDLLDKLALFWKVVYSIVSEYRKKHQDWLFFRYEDICKKPMDSYSEIFKSFDINLSSNVEAFIQASTSYSNYKGTLLEIHSIKRESERQPKVWKERLSESEIARVREIVEDVSQAFYTSEDW